MFIIIGVMVWGRIVEYHVHLIHAHTIKPIYRFSIAAASWRVMKAIVMGYNLLCELQVYSDGDGHLIVQYQLLAGLQNSLKSGFDNERELGVRRREPSLFPRAVAVCSCLITL